MPAPTSQRALSSAGPCPYPRSTRASRPGGTTPRTIEGRATKPCPAERPAPVHRGAHTVTGSSSPPLPPILPRCHPARRAHVLVEAAERAEPRLLGDLRDLHR